MKNILYVLLFISITNLHCTKDAVNTAYASPTGQGGSLARFAISGNYLYSVDEEKLKVFDLTDAAQPVLKTTVDVGFNVETIFPFNNRLFLGSSSVVYIFSVSDPVHPQKEGEAISPEVLRRCDPVVAKDTVAFATLRTNGPCGGTQSRLVVYDIKDVNHPVQKATYPVQEPYGLGYLNDVLYVCDKSSLVVLDISKPYQPSLIKYISNGSYIDVIPYLGTLICWVSNGILLYDITDNRNPVLLAKIL